MRTTPRAASFFKNLMHKKRVENDLETELRAYADLAADEKIGAGLSAESARRSTLIEMGGMEQVKQAVRDQRAGTRFEIAWMDVRFGWRQLLRNPGFTVAVIITLALSIGANTAIFSIVNALILRSLPYPEPDRIGTIFMHVAGGSSPYDGLEDIDGEQWELLRDNVPAVTAAVYSTISSGVNVETAHVAQYAPNSRFSAHYLDVLGIHPMLGRNFTEEEDRPHGPNAAILSYDFWRTVFHADPQVVGKQITVKGEPYTVAGVLPARAPLPLTGDVFTALRPSRGGEGGGNNYGVILRLKSGASWTQVNDLLNRIWSSKVLHFEKEYGYGRKISYHTVPLQRGETAQVAPKALGLMLAAGFILLIACANLAGLTVVRMARRSAEFATRMALGASRWHIQRQLWIENLLLAIFGGAFGVFVGFIALRGLLHLLPEETLPVAGVPMDGRVLFFSIAASLLTSVLFGMLPALALKRIDLRAFTSTRTVAGVERLPLRQMLIAGEVALTVILLTASGLLVRSLIHLQTLAPGFNPQGVMTAKASLDDVRFRDPAAFDRLLNESTTALAHIPGVKAAAVGLSLPYERALNDGFMLGSGPQKGHQIVSGEIYVTSGYFGALEIPLLAGRDFAASDQPKTQHVAVVNRSFARRYLETQNPVGTALDTNGTVIIGVVEDVALPPHAENVNDPLGSEPTVYIPAAQTEERFRSVIHVWFQPSWIVRTSAPVEGLPAQMQKALTSVEPRLPFSGFYSMADHLRASLAMQRVEVALLGAMSGLALLMSAVGIFALVSNIVAQRTREIGIRIALGSSIRQAMAHVAGPGFRSALAGVVLGLVACVGTLRVMRSVIYGVGIYDMPSMITVVVLLLLVTIGATTIPTLRIARTNPASTLREE